MLIFNLHIITYRLVIKKETVPFVNLLRHILFSCHNVIRRAADFSVYTHILTTLEKTILKDGQKLNYWTGFSTLKTRLSKREKYVTDNDWKLSSNVLIAVILLRMLCGFLDIVLMADCTVL